MRRLTFPWIQQPSDQSLRFLPHLADSGLLVQTWNALCTFSTVGHTCTLCFQHFGHDLRYDNDAPLPCSAIIPRSWVEQFVVCAAGWSKTQFNQPKFSCREVLTDTWTTAAMSLCMRLWAFCLLAFAAVALLQLAVALCSPLVQASPSPSLSVTLGWWLKLRDLTCEIENSTSTWLWTQSLAMQLHSAVELLLQL